MDRQGWTRRVLCASAFALLASCGGGGGGGGGKHPPALVEVTFPGARSLAAASAVIVRGTAPDPSRVQDVQVAGVPATTADGFAHWEAVVPIVLGPNVLHVQTVDSDGLVTPATVDLTVTNVGFVPHDLRSLGLDPVANLLYLLDHRLETLFYVDLASGLRSVVSSPAVGAGPAFQDPEGLALDLGSGSAFVSDGEQGLRAVFAVDLVTGGRSILSGAGEGAGTSFSNPLGMVMNVATGRLLVVDQGFTREGVVAVDIATGARTPVSSATTGSGPVFESPQAIAVDVPANRAFVTDGSGQDALFQVDLATGNRAIVSSGAVGSGPAFVMPAGVAWDAGTGDVLVADARSAYGALISVDPLTGDRTVVSDDTTGSGTELDKAADVCLDAAAGSAFVVDRTHRPFQIDLGTGGRALVFDDSVGDGTRLSSFASGPWDVAVDPGRKLAYVTAYDTDGVLLAIDLETGDRSVAAGGSVGSGAAMGFAAQLALDPAGRRAFVGANDTVVLVNLVNGRRSEISGPGVGSGPGFTFASDMEYDAAHGLLVLSSNEDILIAIDPATLVRTVVSGAAKGSGLTFQVPEALAIDPAGGRAFVGDHSFPARLFSIDLATGDRTLLSGDGVGAGPFLFDAADIVVDAAGGRLLLVRGFSDTMDVEVMAVDLVSGDRSLVSDPDTGRGPMPLAPEGMVLDAAARRIFVVDKELDALFLFDVAPAGGNLGDRVIVSR
jgi:DNA-binding beta-propeller fold protein YncE